MGKTETNFKQTDIGLIPHDWEVISLGQIGDVKMCKRIFKSQTKESGEIPFYKIGTFGQTPDAFIPRSIFEEYKAKYSYPTLGVILLSAAGTIGRRVKYKGEDAYYQDSNIIWLNHIEDKILNDYLYYAYARVKWTTEKGAAISRLYNKRFLSAKIPQPPIEEQKRIAEVLSHFDEHIDNLVALLEKRKQVKAATMHALLSGATRLPGFTQPWEDVTLGKIVDLQSGFAFPSANYSTGGKHIVITIANVQNGRLDLSSYNRINQLPANLPLHCLLEKGDLLVTMTGNVGRVCIVTESNCVLNQRVGKLVVKEEICTEFLFHVLNSSAFEEEMIENGQGGAQPNISKVDIESFAFLIPSSVKEQEAIADILSNMDQGIETLEEQIEKYRQMKEGAMEELLTGKVRLI